MSRFVTLIFTLSILLNAALIGLMSGGLYRVHHQMIGDEFKRELSSLPPEVQRNIKQAYKTSREEMHALRKEMREAHESVRMTLNAENFVMRDYERAMDQLNNLRYDMMQIQAKKTGMIATALEIEDRRRFAGYLMRSGRKGGMRPIRCGGAPHETSSSVPARQASPETELEPPAAPTTPAIPDKPVSKTPVKPDPVMLPFPDFAN